MVARKQKLRNKIKSDRLHTPADGSVKSVAKALVSNQLKIRTYTQKKVQKLLCRTNWTASDVPTYTDILGLCKGLHYSLWMQDKLLLKEEVVARYCDILTSITNETVCCHYFRAVLETLAREWDRVDKWREDKFMLLSRDFFARGLHYFPTQNQTIWRQFIGAVFEKILNTDVHHAIGLKMHMCSVLTEELAKKRVKAFCIVNVLSNCVEQLTMLPKHNAYAHAMVRMVQHLQRIVRRHSEADLTQLIDKLDALCAHKVAYRGTLRRLVLILRSTMKKQLGAPSDSLSTICTTESQNQDQTTSANASHDPNPETECMDYDTEVASKKPVDESSEDVKECRKPKHSRLPTIYKSEFSELPKHPLDLIRGEDHRGVSVTPPPDSDAEMQSPTPNTPPPITKQLDETGNSSTASRRRVSFGKVYRKKFLATRRLPLTPTMLSAPSKGILRGHGASRSGKRNSL